MGIIHEAIDSHREFEVEVFPDTDLAIPLDDAPELEESDQ